MPSLTQTIGPSTSDRIRAFRQKAWDTFQTLPWPVRTEELWRRTDPALFEIQDNQLQQPSYPLEVQWETPAPEWISSGVILTDLKTAFQQFPELIEKYLFQTGTPEAFAKSTALHQAFCAQGLFCTVPKGVQVSIPLKSQIRANGIVTPLFPHSLIVVEEGASAILIDERGGTTGSPVISDEMVEIWVKEGACLWYVHLNRWPKTVSSLFTQRALVERDAQFFNLNVGLGSQVTKANIETVLQGTGARSELMGVLFGVNHQHFDFHTLQDHSSPNTFSDLLYKNALRDEAKSIYTGLIRIRKQAQKSNAYQANRNLLLNAGAKADSIPMLEIEADDVRCTHGVATGPVDPEQAFYLMSRGLTQEQAQHLIVEGFFDQVFNRIPVESLRDELREEIRSRLMAR